MRVLQFLLHFANLFSQNRDFAFWLFFVNPESISGHPEHVVFGALKPKTQR